jgi:hypothetical protein
MSHSLPFLVLTNLNIFERWLRLSAKGGQALSHRLSYCFILLWLGLDSPPKADRRSATATPATASCHQPSSAIVLIIVLIIVSSSHRFRILRALSGAEVLIMELQNPIPLFLHTPCYQSQELPKHYSFRMTRQVIQLPIP